MRFHKLPEVENAGIAYEAREVGLSGENTAQSCPASNEFFFQSTRPYASLTLKMSKLTPLANAGLPPSKSNSNTPVSLASSKILPSYRIPNRVCRKVALKF